jgi:hypothetical protein
MSAMTTLPLLDVTMRLCRASNEALAEASGVSCRTIGSARKKKPIRKFLADTISQTLYEQSFEYQKVGPKSGHRKGVTNGKVD